MLRSKVIVIGVSSDAFALSLYASGLLRKADLVFWDVRLSTTPLSWTPPSCDVSVVTAGDQIEKMSEAVQRSIGEKKLVIWLTPAKQQQVVAAQLRQEAQRHATAFEWVPVSAWPVASTQPPGPLAGKCILITRPAHQAEGLAHAVYQYGGRAEILPAIRLEPPQQWIPVDRALGQLQMYDWAIFTSANGVTGFFQRLVEIGGDLRQLRAHLAAIGRATAEQLRKYGLQVDLIPDTFVAEALAEKVTAQIKGGERVLLPRAAQTRPVLVERLRAAGATVDEVAVYRTLPEKRFAQPLQRLLQAEDPLWITFTSSSTVDGVVAALGEQAPALLARHACACIGTITAQHLQALGIAPTVVAQEATADALLEAICRAVREEKSR